MGRADLVVRFLVRFKPKHPDQKEFFGIVRSLTRFLGVEARNPKWTSYGALEIDFFAPTEEDSSLAVAAIAPLADLEFSRNLDEPPRFKPKGKVIDEARNYFNQERFWECHETLESVWRVESGKEKRLLQGIILVAASLVHVQKAEMKTALSVARRAHTQLEWDESDYFGIDVPALKLTIGKMLDKGKLEVFQI